MAAAMCRRNGLNRSAIIIAGNVDMLASALAQRSASRMSSSPILFGDLWWTRSLVGFEVFGNYFYPQLVGDTVYLSALLWAMRARPDWLIERLSSRLPPF